MPCDDLNGVYNCATEFVKTLYSEFTEIDHEILKLRVEI